MTPMPITMRIPSTGELIGFTDGSKQLQCITVALLTDTISKSTFEVIRFRLVGVVEPKSFVCFGSSELPSSSDLFRRNYSVREVQEDSLSSSNVFGSKEQRYTDEERPQHRRKVNRV